MALKQVPRLRARRESLGLSQRELARRAGVTNATVSEAENDRPTQWVTIGKLCEALGCKPADLLAPAS